MALTMKLILIAAMDKNRVIGHKNSIPWHIPEEMQHFKETTMGHAVIMGRKTYHSIAQPLPGRKNVVLTTNPGLSFAGCHVAHSLEEGIRSCLNHEKVFIIGGRTLYREGLEHAETILLSVIHHEYAGDTYFPAIPEKCFQLISEKRMGTEPEFTLQTYRRIAIS